MADNITLPGVGVILASDEVGGAHYEYVKLAFGADNTATIVSGTNPLPVDATPSSPVAGDYLPVRLTDGSSFITAYSAPSDDAAFTPATDKVITSGFFADETSPDSVNEGDIGAARMTLDRWVRVALDARSDVGCDFFKSIDLDETEEEVKATAATLYGGIVINLKATPLYLKLYNATAATVVVGTTVPSLTIPIPSQGTTNGAGFTIPIPAIGVKFGTALTAACTTGIADADAGAPGANECAIALFYK
mgnify:CR=1 FL=1